MIVKKLAVPLINDKILQQAEQCYIATAGISDIAFDFIKNRLSPKCKINIVTGLDSLTSPQVLRRIWRHYQDRITLRIYTRNIFHANVYIFDLPFRKSVAFTGSGEFSMEGLKDHEEIFNKTVDAKEIEAIMSWYTGYFEFAETLTEVMVDQYEQIYPLLRQKEIAIRNEKRQFMELTSAGFNWDSIKFKNQYFKKEDYLVLGTNKASLQSEEVNASRLGIQTKLIQLDESLTQHISALKLQKDTSDETLASAINPRLHRDGMLRTMALIYGRKDSELKKMEINGSQSNHINLQVILQQKNVTVALVPGTIGMGKDDREYFSKQMNDAEYRKTFLLLLASLGATYSIEIAGDGKSADAFQNEELLWEFVKADDWRYFSFTISKNFQPGDVAINQDTISATISSEFDKLMPIFNHIKLVKAKA